MSNDGTKAVGSVTADNGNTLSIDKRNAGGIALAQVNAGDLQISQSTLNALGGASGFDTLRIGSVGNNRAITTGAGNAHQVRSQRWRAAALDGAKPANAYAGFSSVVTPLPIKAAITALGPGTGTTAKPASRTARTTRAPGSLTAGAPASDTSATRWPWARRSQMACAAAASLCR